jgi:LydA holin phage, holin superfamily III
VGDYDNMAQWLFTGGAGVMGRLMFHAREVQSGKRKPISWALFWDIPIALSAGWIALGIGNWAGASWEVTISCAIVVGYLGPYGIDTIFNKWADWKFAKGAE